MLDSVHELVSGLQTSFEYFWRNFMFLNVNNSCLWDLLFRLDWSIFRSETDSLRLGRSDCVLGDGRVENLVKIRTSFAIRHLLDHFSIVIIKSIIGNISFLYNLTHRKRVIHKGFSFDFWIASLFFASSIRAPRWHFLSPRE